MIKKLHSVCHRPLIGRSVTPETDFHIFVRGVDKYLGGGGGGGVLLLALAGAWWQRPERPRKKFNKMCFLGLHGEIWDHNIGNFTNLVVRIIKGGAKTFGGSAKCLRGGGGANHFWGVGVAHSPAPPENPCLLWHRLQITWAWNIIVLITWHDFNIVTYTIISTIPLHRIITNSRPHFLLMTTGFTTQWPRGPSRPTSVL
jgi:hypothetical protein